MSPAFPVHDEVSVLTMPVRSWPMLPSSVATFFQVSDWAAISSALPVRPLRASLSGPTCSMSQPTPAARIAPNGSMAIDKASRAVPTAPMATEAQSPLSIADLRSAADSSSEMPEYAVVESLVSATNGLLIRPPPQSPDRPRSSHQNTPRRAGGEGLMITVQAVVPRVASRSTARAAGPGSPVLVAVGAVAEEHRPRGPLEARVVVLHGRGQVAAAVRGERLRRHTAVAAAVVVDRRGPLRVVDDRGGVVLHLDAPAVGAAPPEQLIGEVAVRIEVAGEGAAEIAVEVEAQGEIGAAVEARRGGGRGRGGDSGDRGDQG